MFFSTFFLPRFIWLKWSRAAVGYLAALVLQCHVTTGHSTTKNIWNPFFFSVLLNSQCAPTCNFLLSSSFPSYILFFLASGHVWDETLIYSSCFNGLFTCILYPAPFICFYLNTSDLIVLSPSLRFLVFSRHTDRQTDRQTAATAVSPQILANGLDMNRILFWKSPKSASDTSVPPQFLKTSTSAI